MGRGVGGTRSYVAKFVVESGETRAVQTDACCWVAMLPGDVLNRLSCPRSRPLALECHPHPQLTLCVPPRQCTVDHRVSDQAVVAVQLSLVPVLVSHRRWQLPSTSCNCNGSKLVAHAHAKAPRRDIASGAALNPDRRPRTLTRAKQER